MAGETAWSPCYTWAISQCFRDKGLIIKRYIHLFTLLYIYEARWTATLSSVVEENFQSWDQSWVEARRVIAGGLRSDVISPARSGVELRLRFRQSEQHKLGFSWYTELYFRGDTCSSEERYISKPKFILQGDQSCRTPPPLPQLLRVCFSLLTTFISLFSSPFYCCSVIRLWAVETDRNSFSLSAPKMTF